MTGSLFRIIQAALAVIFAALPSLAMAQDALPMGQPHAQQMGLQAPATPIMESIHAFHDGLLLWIITAIVIVVALLMIFVMIRFNHRANPVPSKNTHNTLIEIVWTVVPILILIVIAVPSFGVLADQMTVPDGQRKYMGSNLFSFGEVEVPAPGLTVKVTGYQWYWGYEYVDNGNASFDSVVLNDEERAAKKPGQPRLLAVDNELVVPVNTTVRVQVTAADVIHAFAIPSFGIKVDAVPGRLNETWFQATKTGIFYGQCSELCGKDHAYMPIAIRVVEADEYAKWMAALEGGDVDSANMTLAAIQ